MKLLKFIFHRPTWQKLPMIPRQYSTEWRYSDIDRDTETLMRLTQVRSPAAVKLLMQKHGVKTPRELIDRLPPRKRPRYLKRRVLSLLQRATGALPYDPMKSIARQHMRKGRS